MEKWARAVTGEEFAEKQGEATPWNERPSSDGKVGAHLDGRRVFGEA